MKQVTGSNTPQTIDKVSIQLALDGHSFSAPTLSESFPGGDDVEVEVLTPRTLLVPEPLFEAGRGAELLAAAGLTPTPDEELIYSLPRDGVIAVMAIPAEALRAVEKALSTRARYTTPLLTTPVRTNGVAWLGHTAGLLYIKVYDESLQFAEVIPAVSDADVRYFFERLSREFMLKNYDLYISADTAKSMRKIAGKYFKQIVCE